MGNITQLRQGSLDGLRRQTNECLDNAYNKGYQDGKLDFTESNGQAEYNNGYKQGIADYRKFEKFFHSDGAAMFDDIRNTDGTLSLEMILLYLPMSEIMTRIKAYEEKKKAEEKIKVGDIVYYSEEMLKAIVLDIVTGQGVSYAIMLDENGLNVNEELSELKFIEHTNELEQLLNKLRNEE